MFSKRTESLLKVKRQPPGSPETDFDKLNRTCEELRLRNQRFFGNYSDIVFNCSVALNYSFTGIQLTSIISDGGGFLVNVDLLMNFSNLRTLSLSTLRIVGSLQSNISKLSSLVSVSFVGTSLSGTLPKELFEIKTLQELRIEECAFTGSIPSLEKLTKLRFLRIYLTQVSGSLSRIGMLQDLQTLELMAIQFNGTIPNDIGLLKNISVLKFHGLPLQGSIPTDIGLMENLQTLELIGNSINQTIPSEIGNLKSLTKLNLMGNTLVGTLPSELGKLKKLTSFIFGSNLFSGTLPDEIWNITTLTEVLFADNTIAGTIPPKIAQLINLQKIIADNNQIVGSIPSTLGLLENLNVISLSYNQLGGSIPSEISYMKGLIDIKLDRNNLVGNLPIFNQAIRTIKISSNQLSGDLNNLNNSRNLNVLSLNSNKLSGSLPSNIGSTSIISIDLSNNSFIGQIPQQWASFRNLQTLDLQKNKLQIKNWDWFSKNCPYSTINLSGNNLVDLQEPPVLGSSSKCSSISVDFSNTSVNPNVLSGWNDGNQTYNFARMNLARNNLNGSIYFYLQLGRSLKHLNLSYNFIEGALPFELFSSSPNLQSFEVLDLSFNRISGTLPNGLFGRPRILESIDLSYNRISQDVSSWPSSLLNDRISINLKGNELRGELSSTFMRNQNQVILSNNRISCVGQPQWCASSSRMTTVGTGQCAPCVTICGDGYVDAFEACDDGNIQSGDGCSNCTIENGWTCSTNFSIKVVNESIAAQPSICSRETDSMLIILAVVLPIAFLALLLLLVGFFYRKLKQKDDFIHTMKKELDIPDNHLINEDDITLERVIGEGNFGKVYIGKLNNTTTVAIKQIKGVDVEENPSDKEEKEKEGTYSKELRNFIREAKTMSSLHPHPHIVQFLGACVSAKHRSLYLVTQYLPNQNMLQYLKNYGFEITLRNQITLMMGVASGMFHLVKYGIIHNDLAARNVLVEEVVIRGRPEDPTSSELIAKVADFGLAKGKRYSVGKETTQFPIRWTAPEILEKSSVCSSQSDVWSYGVVMYEAMVCCVHIPYAGMSNREVVENITQGKILPSPPKCPAEIYKIMQHCMSYNPSDRPSFDQIYNDLSSILQQQENKSFPSSPIKKQQQQINNKKLPAADDYQVGYGDSKEGGVDTYSSGVYEGAPGTANNIKGGFVVLYE